MRSLARKRAFIGEKSNSRESTVAAHWLRPIPFCTAFPGESPSRAEAKH